MQGEVLNQANIGYNQQKLERAGHIVNAVKFPSNVESNLNADAASYKHSKEHAAILVTLPGHVEGAEISPTSVGANLEATTAFKTTSDRVGKQSAIVVSNLEATVPLNVTSDRAVVVGSSDATGIVGVQDDKEIDRVASVVDGKG